ncbi:tetratricopeptide repeat protein [Chitinophaga niabensis]|uniref:Tetratricopeptide repeat-containing protein n=1 Tax=Chitinophaga niabensis TaxID=536979 RepID=A0A1N6GU36_9BACT|nr:tetratricopeptide repeat protein [Chitinophaga niabensis]SIO10855.1 Tetratricopeptide repeat-containing protein [Chitinophaga niabensis]
MNHDFPSFNEFNEDFEDLRDLLQQFENLKEGRSHSFLDEDSFEQIIDYYDEHDELNNAMQAVEIAIEQFPFSSALLLKKSALLIETKKYREALQLLEKAAVLDSNDINLYILKTDVYLAMNQHEKAAKLLEEQIKVFDGEDRTDLLLELADVYDDWEEFEKVFDCLKMLLEFDPTNEEALHKICFWTEFTGRNEESIRLHTSIINEHPYNQLAWFNLGTAYQGLKLYEKAVDAYQYAVVIDERFDYAYRNMGDAYIHLRKFNEAIEVLQKHLEVAKPEDVIYEAIGHCYEKMRKFTQARYYYRKASHLSPNDDKLYLKIAKAYMTEENWENAIKSLQTAIRLNKQNLEYNITLGQCLLQIGSDKEALVYFLNAVRIRPGSAAAWKELIRGLYLVGHVEEAYAQLEIAESKIGRKPVFLYYKAVILISMGRTKEGLIQLETALQLHPRQFKKVTELDPSILQHNSVVELIARYRRKR